jgi:hypothetical protein
MLKLPSIFSKHSPGQTGERVSENQAFYYLCDGESGTVEVGDFLYRQMGERAGDGG